MRHTILAVPRALVGAVVATALTALAAVAPAQATDLDGLRARAQAIADDVSGLEHRLADIRSDEARIARRVAATSREIAILEQQIQDNRVLLAAAMDKFVERAVEAYKSGGASTRLALLLSSRTIGDMLTIAHATSEMAELDADAIETIHAAREAAQTAQDEVDARKQRLLAAESRARELRVQTEAAISARRSSLRRLTNQIDRLEAEARAQAALAPQPGEAFLQLLQPAGPAPHIPDGFVGTGVTFEGIASWYGPGFEGNPTASGDIFDPDLFTAASKELPLGTWLYVTHRGQGVVVLVNDRGPYVGERVLDLSRAAAFSIGITGLGWVEAEILLKR